MKEKSIHFLIQESNVHFHTWMLIADGFTSPKLTDFLGDYIDEAIMYFINDDGKWGVSSKKWNALGKRVLEQLTEKKLDIDALIEKHHNVGSRLYTVCNEIHTTDLNKIEEREIADFLNTLWENSFELNLLGLIPVLSDFEHTMLSNELLRILRSKKVPHTDIQRVLSVLISMNRETLYWREERDLLQLLDTHGNAFATHPDFKEHVNTYFWLNFGYVGPVWSEDDFIARAKKYVQSSTPISQQLSEHRNKLEDLKNKQEVLEKQIDLSPEEVNLFKAARVFMYLKAYRMEVRHRVNYTIESIFSALAKRYYVPIHVFHYMTCEEVLNTLQNKEIKDSTVFLERRKRMLYITKKGQSHFVEKEHINTFLKTYLIEELRVTGNEARGQVAFQGIVQGIVRIINHPKDNNKVEEGDILISISTNPDLLPAMSRAAAFVTDTGGITSHAAIVAREMQKPCVIGTRNATQVFKDGDEVEVDAEKGIIRKL